MLDPVEVAELLDILGNRNRRRIIELLRQKPCFVTEISDRLTISPKAVIDHLQMLEEAEILACRMDERRRKYYYLANDIIIAVSRRQPAGALPSPAVEEKKRFFRELRTLRQMIRTRDEMLDSVEHLERDIERQISTVMQQGREIIPDDGELRLAVALGHYNLSQEDLAHMTGMSRADLEPRLASLVEKGIADRDGDAYMLRTHAG